MDLQFFFFEITYGCNINREQEQILMFKLYLKFPGTAGKQSQRERPEVAEAPLGLLWGRRPSAATKVLQNANQGGTAARSTDFGLWAALSTSFAFSNLAQNPQNLTDKPGGRAVAPPLDCRPEQERTQAEPRPPSHHGSHLPPACLQLPKQRGYKSQPASRGEPAPRACS